MMECYLRGQKNMIRRFYPREKRIRFYPSFSRGSGRKLIGQEGAALCGRRVTHEG